MDESTTHEPEPITDEGTRVIAAEPAAPAPGGSNGGPATEEAIREALKQVVDPELGINIVDLGLVYDCRLTANGDGTRDVAVRMTLTAPGCGMGEVLVADVRDKLKLIPTIRNVDVELIFDPPWNQSMMSEVARLQTGMM
jgi:probable FeS assembly SUF system protein SufT